MILRIDRLQTELPPPSDPDPAGASVVQELLGGKYGEMSTFMNYTYQSFNFRNRQGARPFYDLVASIAAEEFGHIELVATAINTMLTGSAGGKAGELSDLSDLTTARNTQQFIAGGAATLVQDSMGKPWSGDYVNASGDLIGDLTFNFFLETGARNNKLKVYEMVDHPAARALTGYLLVRGGVHQVAYARALENLTGVDMMKLFPSPGSRPTRSLSASRTSSAASISSSTASPRATSARSRPSSTARTRRPARSCSSPRSPTPRAHRRLTCLPRRPSSPPDPTRRCSPRSRPSCARPPACRPSRPAPSPRTPRASSDPNPAGRRAAVVGATSGGQQMGMRVVVTGATGNVGTALVRALQNEPAIQEIIAVARRTPTPALGERVRFVAADVARDDLEPIFQGADAVVHLAWLIQPGRDESITSRVNVEGSRRVFRAVVGAGVGALVHASSVGVYSPGPKDRRVDETWPIDGIPSSFYSRHKAQVERELDLLALEQPTLRIVRLRPGLIFQRSAATEIRRLFAGPLLPGTVLRSAFAPLSPAVPRLHFQAVHSDDVADAYRRAVVSDASGPFNIAAEPEIGARELAELLHARPVPVPAMALRGLAAAAYKLRLTPVEPGWLDLALGVPLMDTTRARTELGWTATRSATDALAELMAGMRDGADGPTPPLSRSTSGPLRIHEFLTGIGRRP